MSTRRAVLLSAVAALGAAVGVPDMLSTPLRGAAGRERLIAALGLDAGMLTALLEHSRTRQQLADILSACGPKLDHLYGLSTDRELRATLRRWITEDFEQGSLVDVDGWQLAASEALVLAAVATAPA